MFEMFSRDRASRMTPEMFRFIQITSLRCTAQCIVQRVVASADVESTYTQHTRLCVLLSYLKVHQRTQNTQTYRTRARVRPKLRRRECRSANNRHASIERDGQNWCGRQSGVDVNVTTCFWCIYCGYMFCGWPPSHRAAAHTTYTNISYSSSKIEPEVNMNIYGCILTSTMQLRDTWNAKRTNITLGRYLYDMPNRSTMTTLLLFGRWQI